MVIMSAAQFKQLYTDPAIWDRDGKPAWYVEDLAITIVEEDKLDWDAIHNKYGDELQGIPDEYQVKINGGWMEWQGRGTEPSGEERDFEAIAKAWLEKQTNVIVVARFAVDKTNPGDLDHLIQLLKEAGGEQITINGKPEAEQDAEPRKPKP